LVYVPFSGHIRKDITTNHKLITMSLSTIKNNFPNIQKKPNNTYIIIQKLTFNIHSNIKNKDRNTS